MTLRELQRRFRNALLDGGNEDLAGQILSNALAPARRLQIHRNNAVLLLTEALMGNFPASCAMVDRRFFAYAAAQYIRLHPPRQPRLAEYGADLPRFLAGFPPAAHLPWLGDLARLEWTMLRCQEDEATPGHGQLLASPWPVDRIRDFALSGGREPPPPLKGDPVRLQIRRAEQGVCLRRLSESEFSALGGVSEPAVAGRSDPFMPGMA
jgi:hypothetical protein